jgi:hypothetical protein
MMEAVISALVMIVLSQPMADDYPDDPERNDVTGNYDVMEPLVMLDREVSGLLDAYLEAVPECPVRQDTPLRMWVLDLAWLRADAAIDEVMNVDYSELFTDNQMVVWDEFRLRTKALFDVYTEVQRVYHESSPPDTGLSIRLEDSLLEADSLWRESEMILFETISEEELL